MSTVKVIELMSESEKSWEDAAQLAIDKAAKTLDDVKSIYIQEMEAKVKGNKIIAYRINAKISFLLH